MSANSRLLFLLGAGISIPAGLPKTSELTQKILFGDGVILESDGIYYLNDDPSDKYLTDEFVPRIKTFLKRLKREVDSYYKNSRESNYEDIYYLVAQIRDSEDGEYDNPALNALIGEIFPDIAPLLKPDENGTRKNWTLSELANESCNYIYDIVWHSLLKPPEQLDYLSPIFDACFDKTLSHVDICTINHDTLLEQYLKQNLVDNPIQVSDGFGPLENGSRFWDRNLLSDERVKVRLVKLHGSINWFKIQNDIGGEKIVIPPRSWDIDSVRDHQGQIQRPVGRRPTFLAGTFNKMLGYTQSIFADLYCQFHNSLGRTNSLVVSGYSFHDKGINTQMAEWLYTDMKHKMIVIHSEPETLLSSARGAISKNWKIWKKNQQLIAIPKMIEDVNWNEISPYLEMKE